MSDQSTSLPLLYSFRRCPFAIRARLAIYHAEIDVELHEVTLKDKPKAMLELSSKGTVPVLYDQGQVIDESLDIMLWALNINDPDCWLSAYTERQRNEAFRLISENDNEFKPWLDKYKYSDRYPEHDQAYYRQQCDLFLQKLEEHLQSKKYLLAGHITLVDMAIFPFIRQFSMVDKKWFDQCEYTALRGWLYKLLELPLFKQVMQKQQ